MASIFFSLFLLIVILLRVVVVIGLLTRFWIIPPVGFVATLGILTGEFPIKKFNNKMNTIENIIPIITTNNRSRTSPWDCSRIGNRSGCPSNYITICRVGISISRSSYSWRCGSRRRVVSYPRVGCWMWVGMVRNSLGVSFFSL